MSNLSKRVTDELNAELGRKRLSGREIARRLGVPTTTVNRWLRYETPMSIDQAGFVARAIEVRIDEIFARANRRESEGNDAARAVGDSLLTDQFSPQYLRLLPGEGDTSPPIGELAAVS